MIQQNMKSMLLDTEEFLNYGIHKKNHSETIQVCRIIIARRKNKKNHGDCGRANADLSFKPPQKQ